MSENTLTITANQQTIADKLCEYSSALANDFDQQAANAAELKDLRDAASAERTTSETNQRMPTLAKVAQLASQQGWTLDDISAAASIARKKQQGNRADKDPAWRTMSTFIAEMTVCVHPSVRKNFDKMVACASEAWNAENAAVTAAAQDNKSKPATPVHDYKSRLYALVIDIARKTRDGAGKQGYEIVISVAADVTRYAIEHDPNAQAKIIARRCKTIAAQIQKMRDEFQYKKFDAVITYLLEPALVSELNNARQAHQVELANAVRKTSNLVKMPKPATATPVTAPAPTLAAQVLSSQLTETDEGDEDNEEELGVNTVDELMEEMVA